MDIEKWISEHLVPYLRHTYPEMSADALGEIVNYYRMGIEAGINRGMPLVMQDIYQKTTNWEKVAGREDIDAVINVRLRALAEDLYKDYNLSEEQIDEIVRTYGDAWKEEIAAGTPIATTGLYQQLVEFETSLPKEKAEEIQHALALQAGVQSQIDAGYMTEITPEQEAGLREYAKYDPTISKNIIKHWGKTYWRKPSQEVTAEYKKAQEQYARTRAEEVARATGAGQVGTVGGTGIPYVSGIGPFGVDVAASQELGKARRIESLKPELEPAQTVLEKQLKDAGVSPAMQQYYMSQLGNIYGEFTEEKGRVGISGEIEDPREAWRRNLAEAMEQNRTMGFASMGEMPGDVWKFTASRGQKLAEEAKTGDPWAKYIKEQEQPWYEEFLSIPRRYRVGGSTYPKFSTRAKVEA